MVASCRNNFKFGILSRPSLFINVCPALCIIYKGRVTPKGLGVGEFIDLQLLAKQVRANISVHDEIELKKEQYYLDLLCPYGRPSLNINKIAGSMLGFKHSMDSRLKISDAMSGSNNPNYQLKGENHPIASHLYIRY